MAIEPRLNELKGNSRLALGFFNSLIRRIECTKPLAGENITIREKPDGIQISLSATPITLNVCSNGSPDTIVVYGVS